MSSQFFFARLIPKRPDFVMTMSPEEQTIMGAHAAFLEAQCKAGTLVVAGPVLAPSGPYGMAVFEVPSKEALDAVLATDPAQAIGHYEVTPMASARARPFTAY